MSPRKVRLVIDAIRGLSVDEAMTRLSFIPKAASEPVKKLLESAVANAEHNFKLKRTDLYVKAVSADGGPTLKRWQPRAFGRAAPIRKRTSHVQIVLAPISEKPADKKTLRQAEKAERRAARRDSWLKKKAARKASKPETAMPVKEEKAPKADAPVEKPEAVKPEAAGTETTE